MASQDMMHTFDTIDKLVSKLPGLETTDSEQEARLKALSDQNKALDDELERIVKEAQDTRRHLDSTLNALMQSHLRQLSTTTDEEEGGLLGSVQS